MADFDLDMKIKALVEGAKEVSQLADELHEVRRQGQKDIPDNTERLRRGMRQTKKQTDLTTAGMRALRGAIVAVGGAAAVYMGVRLATSIAQAGLEMERMERGFSAITDSSREAREEMDFVRAVANKYGGDLQRLSRDYLSLTAAARGTNLEGELTRQIFIATTEAATALGLSADTTSGALTAIQQMISKGNVSAEELRQQLGERLPGAFQIAARSIGVTTAELGKMLEQGQLTAEELLPSLARELRETYGKAAVESTDSAQAAIGRFNTMMFELKAELAEDLLPAIIEAIENLGEVLNDPGVREGLVTLIKAMGTLITTSTAAAASIANFFGWIAEEAAAIAHGPGLQDIVRIEQRLRRLRDLLEQQESSGRGDSAFARMLREQIKELEILHARAKELQELGREVGDGDAPISLGPIDITATATEPRQRPGRGFGGIFGTDDATQEAMRDTAKVYRDLQTAADEYAAEIARLDELLASGMLGFEAYNKAVADAKTAYEEAVEAAREAGEDLNEFAIQAARNTQSAFADFFFDPVEEGFEGLFKSFRDLLRRMVAEMAAQELLTGIASSALGQSLGLNTYVQHHGGGVVGGPGGMMRTASPLAFIGAQRFHRGGEVPAILEAGEEVLTEDNPRHVRNGGKQQSPISVQVINQGTPQEPEGEPTAEQTPEGLVVGIVLRDQERNGPMTRGFKGVLGSGRRGRG